MKFLIKPPADSGKPDFVKEFASREELDHWLLEKNNEIWEANPLTEKVSFPLNEII